MSAVPWVRAGVDAGIRHLAGIEDQSVEYDWVGFCVPHPREDDLSRACLVINCLPCLFCPDGVAPVIDRTFLDADCVPGAHRNAPVAGDTLARVHVNRVIFLAENIVRAVFDTPAAEHATALVDESQHRPPARTHGTADIHRQETKETGFKGDGDCQSLVTPLAPNLELATPIMVGHMSYGAISLNAQRSIAMAVKETGTYMGTGEGGLHPSLYPFQDHIIVQVASGRFGVDIDYLERGAAIEIKIGQGAKPGIGGHLPGEKVCEDVSCTRMIPVGSDAISPAPHHDIYSIEDLKQLVRSLKEATEWKNRYL